MCFKSLKTITVPNYLLIFDNLKQIIESEAKRRELLLHVYGIKKQTPKIFKNGRKKIFRRQKFFILNSILTWTGPARHGTARPWRSLTAYISVNIKARQFKFLYSLEQLFKIVVLSFETAILNSLEIAAILKNKNFDIFQ